ncbi:exonuclease [Phormidium tenue FACHB-886]|nr:exonuclease [Phormidium tenue FACHB-886]
MSDSVVPLTRYPPKIVRQGQGHFYQSPNGLLLPSISAILSATRPVRERIVISRWRKRVGNEEANRISRESILRGKRLHQRLEHYLSGQPLAECPEWLKPWRDSLKPVLASVEAVLLVEGAVFHEALGYAGTLDLVAQYGDAVVLIDWKTASSARKDEYLGNYKLQVAALWGALAATYDLRLEQALIAIALPDRPAQLVWLDVEQLEEAWQQWLERLEQWYDGRKAQMRGRRE